MTLRWAGVLLVLGTAPVSAVSAQSDGVTERDTAVISGRLRLPATLSIPSGASHSPAVVLVHGSGPNDRDETVGANKPFRDLAAGLAERGIVVLRYDKRSRVAPLTFIGRPFTVDDEVVDDALLAVALVRGLSEVDPRRVVVLGHSLGGMMAPRIGERDPTLAGLVIMAGANRPLTDMIEDQIAYMRSLPGADTAALDAALVRLQPDLAAIRAMTPADSGSPQLRFGAPPAYWLDLAGYDAVATAAHLPMPLLVLQGGRDYQVTMAEFEEWREGLAGNPAAEFRDYPALNHLFIAGTGASSPAEYGVAGHVDEQVIGDIAAWVLSLRPTGTEGADE